MPHATIHFLSAKSCAKIFGPLLLVDGRALREMRVLTVSYPVSRAYKCKVWFLSLDEEPISGSHFSSFLHILPLNNLKMNFNEKDEKTNYSTVNACEFAIFLNF
jgi:hypothetical protein